MARHADIFKAQKVLEIGAGIGLCGIVATACGASSVHITDYSEIILENIVCNVALNGQSDCPPQSPPLTQASRTPLPLASVGE